MLIKGVGIDIIEIDRIQKAIERWGDRFLKHVYTPKEISYAQKYQNPYSHYAGRFAAKEAIYKALGQKNLSWKDISIVNDTNGKPLCYLSQQISKHILLSISHSRLYAVAQAIVIV